MLSCIQLFGTPWISAHQASLPFTISALHYLSELGQTHIHWVSDAIQPSHSLSSPFPPVLNLLQPQGLFQWVSSSHQVAKVLKLQLHHHSFQWINIWSSFLLGLTGLISLLSKGLSRVFSSTSSKVPFLWCSDFFMVQLSHPLRDYWKNRSFDYTDLCQQGNAKT